MQTNRFPNFPTPNSLPFDVEKRISDLSIRDRRFDIFRFELRNFLTNNKRLQNVIMTNPTVIFNDPEFLSFINRPENSSIKSILDIMSPDPNQEAAFRCYNAFYNDNTNQSIENIRRDRILPLQNQISPLETRANELSSRITQLQNELNPIQNQLTPLRNKLIDSQNQVNYLTNKNKQDLQNLNRMSNERNIPRLFDGERPLSSIAEYCKRTNNYSSGGASNDMITRSPTGPIGNIPIISPTGPIGNIPRSPTGPIGNIPIDIRPSNMTTKYPIQL